MYLAFRYTLSHFVFFTSADMARRVIRWRTGGEIVVEGWLVSYLVMAAACTVEGMYLLHATDPAQTLVLATLRCARRVRFRREIASDVCAELVWMRVCCLVARLNERGMSVGDS